MFTFLKPGKLYTNKKNKMPLMSDFACLEDDFQFMDYVKYGVEYNNDHTGIIVDEGAVILLYVEQRRVPRPRRRD